MKTCSGDVGGVALEECGGTALSRGDDVSPLFDWADTEYCG